MTNGYKGPEDYEDGIVGLLNDKSDEYEPLKPLGQRGSTEINLKTGNNQMSEAELALKFGYSQPIAKLSERTETMYGYIRDGNLEHDIELSALTGTNVLNDMVMNAECLNRKARYQEEERIAQECLREMGQEGDTLKDLLQKWSSADAFILYARIIEERDGLEAGKPLYDEFDERMAERNEAERAASELSPMEYRYFGCRTRQYQIMRERNFDLALGYPIYDYTDLKEALEKGANVHKLIPQMPWPFKHSYQLVARSTADGNSFRELLMSLMAQQLPHRPAQQSWGMPQPGYYGPQMPGFGPGGEDEEEQDKRRPLFGFGGPKQPKQPEEKPRRRRRRGRGKR